jgi:hypothetical protein
VDNYAIFYPCISTLGRYSLMFLGSPEPMDCHVASAPRSDSIGGWRLLSREKLGEKAWLMHHHVVARRSRGNPEPFVTYPQGGSRGGL